MTVPVHTVADAFRYYGHPEVAPLRAEALRINGLSMTGRERAKAMKPALNAIRDKIAELKARGL